MLRFIIIFFIFPTLSWSQTFKYEDRNDTTSPTTINASQEIKSEIETKSFKPFDCKKLKTEYLRVNNRNDCLIIQELSNKYEVKTHDIDPNTWNRSQLLRYIDNKDGEKIVAHTWNNVVKWGEKSNKQPFSHLAVLEIPNLNNIFDSNLNQISSNHYKVPLIARRVDTIDTDNDGDKK